MDILSSPIYNVCLPPVLAYLGRQSRMTSVIDFGSGLYTASTAFDEGVVWCFRGREANGHCKAWSPFTIATRSNLTVGVQPVDFGLALEVSARAPTKIRNLLSHVAALCLHGVIFSFIPPSTLELRRGLIAAFNQYGFAVDDKSSQQLSSECCCRALLVFQRSLDLLNPMGASRYYIGPMKAYFINADVDFDRSVGTRQMCAQLHLECIRIVPPAWNSPEVIECFIESGLFKWECSLSYAHRTILSIIAASTSRALVLEDDARLNSDLSPSEARRLLADVSDDFVMGGWCHPSCSHAYVVSPRGAVVLLARGFHRPVRASDQMYPHFTPKQFWHEIERMGGKLLYPYACPKGVNFDLGMFCQDRSKPHGNAYYLEYCQTKATPVKRRRPPPRANNSASEFIRNGGYRGFALTNGQRAAFDSFCQSLLRHAAPSI